MNKYKKSFFIFLAVTIFMISSVTVFAATAIHIPEANPTHTTVGHTPNAVLSYGCSDTSKWVVFHYVPQSKLSSLKIGSNDWNNVAHIEAHNGLDGIYDCYSGYCTVHVCGKDGGSYNAWEYRLQGY